MQSEVIQVKSVKVTMTEEQAWALRNAIGSTSNAQRLGIFKLTQNKALEELYETLNTSLDYPNATHP